MKKRLAYIVSNINKAFAFEWIVEHINQEKFELSFILLNNELTILERFLIEKGVFVIRIDNPGKRYYPVTFFRVLKVLRKLNPHIVHCHLFDAAFLGLMVSKLIGVEKRIYTRHHSTYNHEYVRKMVLFDKACNIFSTKIVAISQNVKDVLIENERVLPRKIELIHHGFALEKFREIDAAKLEILREKYISESKFPVVGVISRWFELKGIEYIIRAFKELKKEWPDAFLILANATGPYEGKLKAELEEFTSKDFVQISFENDLFHLYALFDLFVHVPINSKIEAFGQIYVESLAAGVPSIFTISGVANEFIENGFNASVVPYENSNEIHKALEHILSNKEYKEELKKNGIESVKRFGIKQFISKLESLYDA